VDNLLDREYEDVLHFAAPRRSWMLGARLEGVI
jgi:outer membrane cobalamin receptor